MLTNPQKALLKRAQREAHIENLEYRNTLEQLCGVRSSTDPKMSDGQVDVLMKYFEAVFWRQVDRGDFKPPVNPTSVFRVRGYWLAKNPPNNSSRAQYSQWKIEDEIAGLEDQLAAEGCSQAYCDAIKRKTGNNLFKYEAALQRTLTAKLKNADVPAERRPF